MEKTQNTVSFYKLFFNEELYHIGEKKSYASAEVMPKHEVSEEGSHYVSGSITSKTLIMFSGDIPGPDKIFLDQILKAVGLGYDKVSRLNTNQLEENMTWEKIAASSTCEYIIAFGTDLQHKQQTGIVRCNIV
jgi:hypothetical protein